MLFLTNTNINKHVVPLLNVILTGESIYGTILVIQEYFQDKKEISRSQCKRISFF